MRFEFREGVVLFQARSTVRLGKELSDWIHLAMDFEKMSTTSSFAGELAFTLHTSMDLYGGSKFCLRWFTMKSPCIM